MIETRGLTVEIDGHRLVADVDLAVDAGRWLGLIGPNGAGKTTLLKTLLGQTPFRGTCSIEGKQDLNRRERSMLMAFVPQRPLLPPAMTVFQYVLLGRTPHISYLRSESVSDLQAAAEALEALELTEYVDRELQTLSGGEQQRAVLARAIAQDAPILLMDEPTSALDIGHQLSVLSLVDRLRRQRNLTVITALHDLTLAAQFCDSLLLLSRGRVVASGEAIGVLTEENVRAYFDAGVEVLVRADRVRAVVPQRTNEEMETPMPPRVPAP